jgi:predicted RNA-binding protein YlqC (UPF0109 family)
MQKTTTLSKDEFHDFEDWISFTVEMLTGKLDDSFNSTFKIEITQLENKIQVIVHGPRAELGKIIGKQGSTINAIRHIALASLRSMGIGYFEITCRQNDAVEENKVA